MYWAKVTAVIYHHSLLLWTVLLMIAWRCRLSRRDDLFLGLDLQAASQQGSRAAGLKLKLELEVGVGPKKAVGAERSWVFVSKIVQESSPETPLAEQAAFAGRQIGRCDSV